MTNRERFYNALNKLDISYDEETGKLSKTITILAYESNRKIKADKIKIYRDHFSIEKKEEDTTRKIYFKNVNGFKYEEISELVQVEIPTENNDSKNSSKTRLKSNYKSVRIYPEDFKEYRRLSYEQDKTIVELVSEALQLIKKKYED